jgi:hypothetical protein
MHIFYFLPVFGSIVLTTPIPEPVPIDISRFQNLHTVPQNTKPPGAFHILEAWSDPSSGTPHPIGISIVRSDQYNCTTFLNNLDTSVSGTSIDESAGSLADWFHSNKKICGKGNLDFWLRKENSTYGKWFELIFFGNARKLTLFSSS